MSSSNRVVITGLGTVNACGLSVPESWAAVKAGVSGIGPLTRFGTEGFTSRVAGELPDFDPTVAMERHEVKRFDPFIQFALVAAKEAVEDSGIDFGGSDSGGSDSGGSDSGGSDSRGSDSGGAGSGAVDLDRAGTIIGSGIGGLQTIEEQYTILGKRGPGRISPYFVPKIMMNAASGQVSITYGLRGANFATASACASSAHAVGMAFDLIRRGVLDFALTGGSEAVITPLCVGGFCALKALSTAYNDDPARASRPFDAERDGFVLGEGAGILAIESLELAKKRGARIYAELKGFGQTADAYNIVQPAPEGEGAARAMRLALDDGGIPIDQVDYINAHGTSTPFNDKLETQAIRTVFGEHADRLKVSSSKSMVGHLLGASGAVELIFTSLGIHEGLVHPTINYENPDPDCDLDYVPNETQEYSVRNALSNSLGFGGHNASILVGKFVE